VRYERLGSSGIEVSVVGLGCNTFGMSIDEPASRAVVDAALELGITFFDTATSYGAGASERFLGNAIRNRRDQVVIATKFADTLRGIPEGSPPPGGYAEVHKAVDASLERLGIDHVDVLYYHMPDKVTPIEETLGAMQEVVDAGKARALACSNFSSAELRQAYDVAQASGKPGFTAVQNQYSLLERDAAKSVLPVARELDIAFVPYMPLANGLLTGKYRRGQPPPEGSRLEFFSSVGVGQELLGDDRFDQVERLAEFAEEHGHTLHELAIAALASEPGVTTVLVGATSPEQVRANAAAADWELDAEMLAAVPLVESKGIEFGFSRE
jgi:aryl-alcohol dehydrogenase-like predicted oxidoreductase